MQELAGRAALRAVKSYNKNHPHKKYRASYEMVEVGSGTVRARCDQIGRAAFAGLDIVDDRGMPWAMRPNRRLAPNRWIVTDPTGQAFMQISQKILGALINPAHKVFLVLLDAEGREMLRLVDPRESIAEPVFGPGPLKWVLLAGDRPVAKLDKLPPERARGEGLGAKLKAFFTAGDWAVVSADGGHALPAPAALALIVLFRELSDVSGG
jgi:hypothetical protein